jgi:hypothetical protein
MREVLLDTAQVSAVTHTLLQNYPIHVNGEGSVQERENQTQRHHLERTPSEHRIMLQELPPSEDGLHLYKGMHHPVVPNLFFNGFLVTFMAPLTSSVQAAWIAEAITGSLSLPSSKAMCAEIEQHKHFLSQFPFSRRRSCIMQPLTDNYHTTLLTDMGVMDLTQFGGFFGPVANAVLPVCPYMFDNALEPAAVRKRRSLKPPRVLKACVLAAATALFASFKIRQCNTRQKTI